MTIIMACHCLDGLRIRASSTYKISHKVCAKYSLLQTSQTFALHVAELFGAKRRMGKSRETGTFKPVLWVG